MGTREKWHNVVTTRRTGIVCRCVIEHRGVGSVFPVRMGHRMGERGLFSKTLVGRRYGTGLLWLSRTPLFEDGCWM